MNKAGSKKGERKKKIPFSVVAETYKSNLCNVSLTCDALKINRTTFYNWYNEKDEFRQMIDDSDESMIDFTESKLFQAINDDNLTAIIFFLKTKGKKRGYIESQIISADVTTNRKMTQEEAIDFIKGLEQEY